MSRRLFHGQLADEIAGEDRLRAERLRLLARSLVDILRDALARDGIVRIHGFGTFRLKRMAARRGINPRTGEPIEIPARNRVLFRPARALRDRVEPDHPAAVPLAEPHESREAWLGGRMADSPVAGGLPAGDDGRTRRNYFPDRVAAASMATPTARVTASAHPDGSRDSASREASLGGAMADSPSAGRVVTDDPDAGSRDIDAANDEPLPAGSGTGPTLERPPPAIVAPAEREAAGPSGDVTNDDQRRRDSAPAVGTKPELPMTATTADAATLGATPGPEHEPEPESGRDERGSAGRWMALIALVLLALLLLWWLWPRTEPTPIASSIPGVTTERTGDTASQGEPAPADEAGSGSAEPVASATAPDQPAEAPVEAESESGTGEVADGADASTGTVAMEIEGSPGGEDQGQAQPAPEPSEPVRSEPEEAGVVTAEGAGEAAAADADPASETGAESQPAPEAGSGTESQPAADAGSDTEAVLAEASGTGTTTETGQPATATPWFSGRKHTVAAGDTLWGLSDRHYVNPYFWPHIWNHNGSLGNPDRIEIDQELWLPELVGEPRELTAADRRSIAEGYLRLYRFWTDTGAANPQYALVGVRYFDASVMPPELRDDPSAGRPGDALAAAFEALLMAEFPVPQ